MKFKVRHNVFSHAYIVTDHCGDTIAMFYYGVVPQSIIENQANNLVDILNSIDAES